VTALAEAALRRHRLIVMTSLIVLIALSWAWMFAGAGMGMHPTFSFGIPSADSRAMGDMTPTGSWTPGRFMLTLAMWWVMMVAMMVPSAAPMILLYSKVSANFEAEVRPSSGAFLAGYLIIWAGFSLIATVLQAALEQGNLITRMQMASSSQVLSAAILIGAGLYQLSPLKQVCLRYCRSPAHFISRQFSAGRVGALRMGVVHGTYCLGCCWLLMALLFVGGVMNLAWIALLALLVAAEKLLPFGSHIGKIGGLGLIGWGLTILFA